MPVHSFRYLIIIKLATFLIKELKAICEEENVEAYDYVRKVIKKYKKMYKNVVTNNLSIIRLKEKN